MVVEAGIGSGSLITAKSAVLQGRDVFALPANVGSRGAEGTNGLLKDGAKLALSSSDILEPYGHIYTESLYTERLPQAARSSEADLNALAELGVIELTKPQKRSEAGIRSSSAERPKNPRDRASKPFDRQREEKKASLRETTVAKTETTKGHVPPAEILSSLNEVQSAVLEAIPDDRAVSADQLNSLGYPYGEIIAALTMLEIMGLIHKLPGALYTKA